MEKTENYGLNQWQTTDRILMSDFNADNQKLDAALAAEVSALAAEETARKDAVAAEVTARKDADAAETSAREETDAAILDRIGLQTLYSTTLTADANMIEMPLTGIDWKNWRRVHCVLFPTLETGSTYTIYLNFNANYKLASGVSGGAHILLYPLCGADGPARGVCMAYNGGVFCYGSLPFGSLTKAAFQVRDSKDFLTGTSMTIYGEPA